ncbi:N-acetylmuramoyl-L-alanine amidase [Solibacillus sp. R5-41]|uniref:SH3 domain-containing protein n=1 Tax=Solibacillus sp. R5-41 TaxID=2048654 RepID=UPI000C127830|nr:SH3 domain-containing protein [Solibacillus sp. R5-41]ATP41121.1 N-acetylmuramoyl-L-alanine amidase [Solibacillus sp. R5-41]
MRKRKLMISLIFLLLLTTLFPSMPTIHNVFANDEDLIVNAEILYLREGPGLSYPIIETLQDGQPLTALSKQDDWIQVRAGELEGWVASWLVKSSEKPTAASIQKTVIAQVDSLNLRAEPSLSAAILTKLASGTEAQFLKEQQDWVQIQYGEYTGWVSANYVTINDATVLEMPASKTEQKEEPKNASTTSTLTENDPNTFTITVNEVNVRKKADLTSKKLGTAKIGQQFKVISRDHNWVQIEYENKKKGWVYSFYGTFTKQDLQQDLESTTKEAEKVTIIYNGTNLREATSTASNVVARVDAGQTYPIIETQDDWYKIALEDGQEAYVANWVVTTNTEVIQTSRDKEKDKAKRKKGSLKGLTIVLDAGHGGNDRGTTGARGTDEKDITIKTAELLKSKLQAAGADVIMTRESDVFIDLRKRVAVSHQADADAFISIHYDALEDSSVHGFTTYYTNGYQKELAEYVHAGIASKVTLKDRGARFGDYLVLRENRQNAILLELGYLSNPTEERAITTDYYREQATLGIYQGLLNYFDAQLDE